MEIEGQEIADKSKFAKRSSFKKSKHKAIEPIPVVKENESNGEAEIISPKKELSSIYSHRNEENFLIKHRPGKRSVTFSSDPVRIEYAAPRTFTRHYIKSNHKKKKDTIHSEGLIMLMNNPEVLQRLDQDAAKPAKPADQSTPDSDLSLKPNLNDQIKISFFKPPIAGSYVPPSSIKDGSDGESNSSGESSEENVYVVGQSEHDEECLNILSNGLDDDDEEDDSFFSKSNPLKETNIDDVIFSAKMTEVIEKSSPRKFKETSLIEPPAPPPPAPSPLELAPEHDPSLDPVPPTAEESEESEESSMGSVDSGIHEAGTDHDSPAEERLPTVSTKPTPPPKPSTSGELPKNSVEKSSPDEMFASTKPSIAPKPKQQVVTKPQVATKPLAVAPQPQAVAPKPQTVATKPQVVAAKPQVVAAKPQVIAAKPQVVAAKPQVVAAKPQVVAAKPQVVATKPQVVAAKPQVVAAKPQVVAKPQLHVPAQPRWQRQIPTLSKPLQQVSPQPIQVEQEEETDSGSEESETSSISSDDRPPSPDGHEMTYLQYDEEPMLPKYKKDIQIEKIEEALKIGQPHNSDNNSPVKNSGPIPPSDLQMRDEFAPILRPKAPTPEIPRTSLENFFGPNSDGSVRDSRRDSKRDSQLLERHEMEQKQLRELQKLKQIEEQQLKDLKMQQEIEKQKLVAIQAQQHIQRQMDIKRQQELQLQIEREQLQELQRHRELQQIQEMQRLELIKIQEEERRREVEAQREYQRQVEEQKQIDTELYLDRERVEQDRQAQLERQRRTDELEKQKQLDLIKQIEAEKQRQFEKDRQWQLESEKSKYAHQAQQNAQLNADFEDIDSLLEGLMELDPIISQQKHNQQQRLQQFEAELVRSRQREEENKRQKEEEEARGLQKEKERIENSKLENQRTSAEDAEKKKLSDLEALRERKRKMREMSLDEVLKLQKEKKKGSPTPSIRSESISYASLKRNSNESLHSVSASLDRGSAGPRNQGNQMIAPISLLHEIINPYTQSVQEEPAESSRSLPVIVDNLLVTSPELPPRTDLGKPTYSPNTSLNRADATLHLAEIKTKLEPCSAAPRGVTDNNSPNSLLDPYIVTANIEPYSGSTHVTPNTWSPNTVKAKQQEQWLDIDDLLADVQSMITDNRSAQPAVPPRIVHPSSPRSINTSTSSYNEVFDAPPPPLPPKVPSRPNSPNSVQQPPLPARTFSSPPLSPRVASPAALSTPPRSPQIPTRSNLSDSGRSNPSSETEVIPRSNSDGAQFKISAFQNFQPNPHEQSIRRRSSIEDLNRRTEQLQRNQSYTSSFRSRQGDVYPLAPQPQESTLTTNVTVPFYQPQKMYQRPQPSTLPSTLPPPPQGYGYASPPSQYATPQYSTMPGGSYSSPPLNPVYPVNSAPPPPLPRRHNSDKVAKHHTVV